MVTLRSSSKTNVPGGEGERQKSELSSRGTTTLVTLQGEMGYSAQSFLPLMGENTMFGSV